MRIWRKCALKEQWDPHGGRAIGAREMLGSNTAEYGGEMLYINKSATKPLWAMEYSRDEAARANQDEDTPPFHKDAPDYNRNVETMAVEDVRRWWDYYQQRPGGGDRVSAGGVKIGFTDSNSHFRGDNNYRRSGVVDALRLPKDPWYVHQAMWDGWVEAGGHHVHMIGHWTYPAGTKRTVQVVSNGEAVELFLNGRSLGRGSATAVSSSPSRMSLSRPARCVPSPALPTAARPSRYWKPQAPPRRSALPRTPALWACWPMDRM
jgi:beta-galactosidase